MNSRTNLCGRYLCVWWQHFVISKRKTWGKEEADLVYSEQLRIHIVNSHRRKMWMILWRRGSSGITSMFAYFLKALWCAEQESSSTLLWQGKVYANPGTSCIKRLFTTRGVKRVLLQLCAESASSRYERRCDAWINEDCSKENKPRDVRCLWSFLLVGWLRLDTGGIGSYSRVSFSALNIDLQMTNLKKKRENCP